MGMTTCPDCGRDISDQAVNCPGCGRPMRPTNVEEKSASGLLGRKGTMTHTLNFGCLALLIGIALLFLIVRLAGS